MRPYAVHYYQRFNHNRPIAVEKGEIFPNLDVEQAVDAIHELTGIESNSGPHVVIEGTHHTKTFGEICRIILSDKAAQQKFGDRIKMILGPKGTMLFEETSSFHKAARCKTKRLMLSIDYVLRRTPPPERPRLVTA